MDLVTCEDDRENQTDSSSSLITFQTASPSWQPSTPLACQPLTAVSLRGSLRATAWNYRPILADDTSLEYRQTALKMEGLIVDVTEFVLARRAAKAQSIDVVVVGFRSGSLIVDYKLVIRGEEKGILDAFSSYNVKEALGAYVKEKDNVFGLDVDEFFFEREDDWELEGKPNPCLDPRLHDCHENAECVVQREGYACKCKEGFVDDATHPFDFGQSCRRANRLQRDPKKELIAVFGVLILFGVGLVVVLLKTVGRRRSRRHFVAVNNDGFEE